MSATRVVDLDKNPAGGPLRALADTAGMSPAEQANFWLEKLTAAAHRGPRRDTWTSARERAAMNAGIERSMAARIWHRWQGMRSVSFEVGLKLMLAYEAMCEATEGKAAAFREERKRLEIRNAAAVEGDRESVLGVDSAGP